MRDIGDELAAHGLHLLQFGDILQHYQALNLLIVEDRRNYRP